MAEFEKSFNYDDVFFRDITVSFTSELYRKISWVNKFHDGGDKLITIPFYYSFTGDDRFLLDAFVDPVTGIRPDMNIDPIPRAMVTLLTWARKTNELANPNVRLETYREVDGNIQKVSGYYRQIPLKLTYDLSFILGSEADVWKCSEAILKYFHQYKYFHFEYKYVKINAVMVLPESHTTEINRIISGLDGENNKSIKFSVDVHTSFFIDPTESEVIATNKKVIFKGSTWELKMKNKKRKWLGTDANED